MASKKRSISTAFWSDPWVESLSPSEKLLYLYLITNEKVNMLGAYEVSISKMSFETGIQRNTIKDAISKFESDQKVQYLENFVILSNFLKNQKMNDNMKKSAIDSYNDLPEGLKIKGLDVSKLTLAKGFERLCQGFERLRNIEVESESEVESEVESELDFSNASKEVPTTTKKFNFKNSLIELGFDKNLVDDWMKVRKDKKASNTETALKAFLASVREISAEPNEVLQVCVENSWKGIKKAWWDNYQERIKNTTYKNGNTAKTRDERNSQENADRAERILAKIQAESQNNDQEFGFKPDDDVGTEDANWTNAG